MSSKDWIDGWEPTVQLVAKGSASPEAQIRHLMKCLQISQDRAATLELEIRTLKLGRDLEMSQFERNLAALTEARERLIASKPLPLAKRPWWRFWRK